MEAEKKPLKVGPFGSDSGGDRFDDGVHSSVRQLVICYSPSSIRNIQIEYDDNGKSYWSQKHGYSSSLSLDKIESIKLDYPEEYLTSVHGYYKSTWYLPTYISSLTFTSNRKVYGPFGDYENEGRKYFTIQVSGSKIVGFHGRSDERFDLRALGAYLKPLVHTPQYSNNNISPAPVAHIGYPAASAPPQPASKNGRGEQKKNGNKKKKGRGSSDVFKVQGNNIKGDKADKNGVFDFGNKYVGSKKPKEDESTEEESDSSDEDEE